MHMLPCILAVQPALAGYGNAILHRWVAVWAFKSNAPHVKADQGRLACSLHIAPQSVCLSGFLCVGGVVTASIIVAMHKL